MSLPENSKRIKIITGHFGSGKSEFSLNYALYLKKHFPKVALVDLDIINMYFRTREKADYLNSIGIECFSSSISKASNLDIPAIDPAILKPIENNEYEVIIDTGGNPKGALPLGRYRDVLRIKGYENYFVINRNRPETKKAEDVVAFIRDVEAHSQTKVTGLINTTHMLKSTTVSDILYGQELVEEVSGILNLPIIYVAGAKEVVKELEESGFQKNILFPMELYFRDLWMI